MVFYRNEVCSSSFVGITQTITFVICDCVCTNNQLDQVIITFFVDLCLFPISFVTNSKSVGIQCCLSSRRHMIFGTDYNPRSLPWSRSYQPTRAQPPRLHHITPKFHTIFYYILNTADMIGLFQLVSFLLTLILLIHPPTQGVYSLVDDYSGPEKFFSGFDSYTQADPTSGFVVFVDANSTANSTGLAGSIVSTNSNVSNAVFLGVDHANVTPQGRPALRLLSRKSWNHALWIADIGHAPVGPGTWPAFWLVGQSSAWPAAGEIDIMEGIGGQQVNRMTLHTNAGVDVVNSSRQTGHLLHPNCDVNDPSQPKNAGCGVDDAPGTPSFGEALNANGGGIFATQYTSTGIQIWFWPRGAVPSDVIAGNPDPNNWELPNANWENPQVSWDSHFCELQLIFDTTFCGQWAGEVWANDTSTSVLAPTCNEYVQNHPEAYVDAYWAINSLKVFTDASTGDQKVKIPTRTSDLVAFHTIQAHL